MPKVKLGKKLAQEMVKQLRKGVAPFELSEEKDEKEYDLVEINITGSFIRRLPPSEAQEAADGTITKLQFTEDNLLTIYYDTAATEKRFYLAIEKEQASATFTTLIKNLTPAASSPSTLGTISSVPRKPPPASQPAPAARTTTIEGKGQPSPSTDSAKQKASISLAKTAIETMLFNLEQEGGLGDGQVPGVTVDLSQLKNDIHLETLAKKILADNKTEIDPAKLTKLKNIIQTNILSDDPAESIDANGPNSIDQLIAAAKATYNAAADNAADSLQQKILYELNAREMDAVNLGLKFSEGSPPATERPAMRQLLIDKGGPIDKLAKSLANMIATANDNIQEKKDLNSDAVNILNNIRIARDNILRKRAELIIKALCDKLLESGHVARFDNTQVKELSDEYILLNQFHAMHKDSLGSTAETFAGHLANLIMSGGGITAQSTLAGKEIGKNLAEALFAVQKKYQEAITKKDIDSLINELEKPADDKPPIAIGFTALRMDLAKELKDAKNQAALLLFIQTCPAGEASKILKNILQGKTLVIPDALQPFQEKIISYRNTYQANQALKEVEERLARQFNPPLAPTEFKTHLSGAGDPLLTEVRQLIEKKKTREVIVTGLVALITPDELKEAKLDGEVIDIDKIRSARTAYRAKREEQVNEVLSSLGKLADKYPDPFDSKLDIFLKDRENKKHIQALLAGPPPTEIITITTSLENIIKDEAKPLDIKTVGDTLYHSANALNGVRKHAIEAEEQKIDDLIRKLSISDANISTLTSLKSGSLFEKKKENIETLITKVTEAKAARDEAQKALESYKPSSKKDQLVTAVDKAKTLDKDLRLLKKIEARDTEAKGLVAHLNELTEQTKSKTPDTEHDELTTHKETLSKALHDAVHEGGRLLLAKDDDGRPLLRIESTREELRTAIEALRQEIREFNRRVPEKYHVIDTTQPFVNSAQAKMIIKALINGTPPLTNDPRIIRELIRRLENYQCEFTVKGIRQWVEQLSIDDTLKNKMLNSSLIQPGIDKDRHDEWIEDLKRAAFIIKPTPVALRAEDQEKLRTTLAPPSSVNLIGRAKQWAKGTDKKREFAASLFAVKQVIDLHAKVKQPLALENSEKGLGEFEKIPESIGQLKRLRDQLHKKRKMTPYEANMIIMGIIKKQGLEKNDSDPSRPQWIALRKHLLKYPFTAEGLREAIEKLGSEEIEITLSGEDMLTVDADMLQKVYADALHKNNPEQFKIAVYQCAEKLDKDGHPDPNFDDSRFNRGTKIATTEEERVIAKLEANLDKLIENYEDIQAAPKPVPPSGPFHFADEANVRLDSTEATKIKLSAESLEIHKGKDYVELDMKEKNDATSLAEWEKLASNSNSIDFTHPKKKQMDNVEMYMEGLSRHTSKGKIITFPLNGERITRIYPPIPNPQNTSIKETTVKQKSGENTSWDCQVMAFGGEINTHAMLKAFFSAKKISTTYMDLGAMKDHSGTPLAAVPTKEQLLTFLKNSGVDKPSDVVDQFFGKKRPYAPDIPSWREQYSTQKVEYRNKRGSIKEVDIPSDDLFKEAERMLEFAKARSIDTQIYPIVIQHVANPMLSVALDIIIKSRPEVAARVRLKIGLPMATDEQRLAATQPSIQIKARLTDDTPLTADAHKETHAFQRIVLKETGVSMRPVHEGRALSSDEISRSTENLGRKIK